MQFHWSWRQGLGLLLVSAVIFSAIQSRHALARTTGCLASKCHDDLVVGASVHGPVKASGCQICHDGTTAASAKLPAGHPAVSKLPSDGKGIDSTCVLCHESMKSFLNTTTPGAHKAIADKGCLACHDPHRSQNQKLLKKPLGNETCLQCHASIAKTMTSASHRHSKIFEQQSCSRCHSAHGGTGHASLLRKSVTATCQECHDKGPHAPKTECTSCHAVHGNDSPALLKGRYSEKFHDAFDPQNAELCLKCHRSDLITQPSTRATEFRNGEKNLHHLHLTGNRRVRTCRSCHSPHRTGQEKLIESWVPYNKMLLPLEFKKTPTGGTCASACHGTLSYDRIQEVKNAPKR